MSIIELFNIKVPILNFNDCTFIIVHITIIRSTEYCYYWWEITISIPHMKFIACILYFMCSYNTKNWIIIKEFISSFLTINIRTTSLFIIHISQFILIKFTRIVINRIWPENITKSTLFSYISLPFDLFNWF